MRSGLMAVALITATIFACAGPLPPMPYQVLAELRPGVTSMAEAEAALGAPARTATGPDGEQQWLYEFAPEPVVAAQDLPLPADALQQPETLLLVFSPSGILIRHEASRMVFGIRDDAHPLAPDHEALKEIPLK